MVAPARGEGSPLGNFERKQQPMKWYATHIIMYVQFKDGNQNTYPIWENVVLICAENDDEAFIKAEKIGKDSEGDDQKSMTWGERPATMVFAGIRKLIACVDSTIQPNDGTEITYSQFTVNNKESLDLLVNGSIVDVVYEE
jgi:hypothetical protein